MTAPTRLSFRSMNTASFSRRKRALATLLAACACAPMAFAGDFIHKDAGPYEYTDTANWTGGTINNTWNSGNNPSPSITANQTITFASDYTQLTGWTIHNKNAFNHTFMGNGSNRTVTLGGGISLGSTGTSTTNMVTIGSTTDGQMLNVDLGGANRTISVGTNRTLLMLNVLSGVGSISQTGTGTLRLINTTNTYTGATNFGASGVVGGVIEATKLANGGQTSSIGQSTAAATNLIFGGTTTAGTLRYIGAGDSTDRSFSVGGIGAKFDASGTGALKWTNTAAASWSGSGNTTRAVILTGTNTEDNTMLASFGDNGSGQTSITKQGAGRWILGGSNGVTGTTNTFTGNLTIDAGTLELGSSTSGGNGSNMILNGGTFATGTFSETFGTLALNNNATIDFGSNGVTSDLVFAASNGVTWGTSISLNIINFSVGTDTIRFGVDATGLTVDQLAQITINGAAATINGSGYLTTIPEPSSYAALAGVGAILLALRRRHDS